MYTHLNHVKFLIYKILTHPNSFVLYSEDLHMW